ncbi:transketolase family protein [Desulfotomaculum nigrificans]|uniref:transketolase family protein n=1 Tax=Desulfotomaculum nigrificans TaxID=1565 RepID=UPI0001FADF72|nr:transketolase family protein [Desulfotomaculum nigrificans]
MTQKIATREAYGQELVRLGADNKDVVVLDADLSKSTKTHDFMKNYPDRFFNMGIAEANMMATAAGLAAVGKIPFASTFAIFATGRAFEQIRNSIAYPRLNVKIAATHAGITVGEDGGSHQSIEDIAIMRVLPGMTVFVPADAVETAAAVRAAAEIKGPVYIRLGRSGVPVIHDENFKFIPGEAVTMREGSDVALIATGIMVSAALEAAETLAAEGIEAMVLNVHTIKPLDIFAVVEAARKCGAVVTAEEHSIIGGLGSAVAETLMEHHPVPMKRIGVRDTFGESGKPAELLKHFGLTAADIVDAAKKVMAKKK